MAEPSHDPGFDVGDEALVLDVGGWAAVHPRADWVIDAGPFETRNLFYRQHGERPPASRVTAATWVQRDVCGPEPWPFEDKQFDFVYCSQTIEDVRDPVFVCAEMERVGRSGLIVTLRPQVELTRGIDSPFACGWRHHRWLVLEQGPGEIEFLAKPHHIHDPRWPSVRSPRYLRKEALEPLEIRWFNRLTAREHLVYDFDALDRELLGLLEGFALPDPVAVFQRRMLNGYLVARRRLGRIRRALNG
jgi:hypothetical protein